MTVMPPVIKAVPQVVGRNLVLRDAELEDAEFILQLRLDPVRSKFLSAVSSSLDAQREWLRQYKSSAGQAYFVIQDASGRRLGTVRIYDAEGESFSWGSWILVPDAPVTAALESAILVYWIARELWGFKAAHFKVSRDNVAVVSFHEKLGASRLRESEDEVFMSMSEQAIAAALQRYRRYVPTSAA